MTATHADVLQAPIGRLSPDLGDQSAHQHSIASSLDLKLWRGDLTLFDGFYNTLPAAEFGDVDWSNFCVTLAADRASLVPEKCHVHYFIPSLLCEAPLIGETKARAERRGLPLLGKQRSSAHVTTTTALVAELDGIDSSELQRIEQLLEGDSISYLIYSTYSHGRADKPGVRVRLIIPVDRALTATDYALAAAGLNGLVLAGNADPSGFKLCQQQGVWATAPDRANRAFKRQNFAGVASATALISAAPFEVSKKSACLSQNQTVIFSYDRVRAALKWLSPENYDAWIKVGLWLKAAYGDAGFSLWSEWGEKASEMARSKNVGSEYEPAHKWSNFDPRIPPPAGAGKLFEAAKGRAIDAAFQGFATGDWTGKARDGLLYLRLYHRRIYGDLARGEK